MKNADPPPVKSMPVDRLLPHPDNPNVMSAKLLRKLREHIARTGRYEALLVRPYPGKDGFYQLLNGHHRLKVLKQLGYERVLCQIWDVDDDEARLLLATLNRLAGQDDPYAKGRLIEQLCRRWDLKQLARMLPERREQLRAILDLSRPPAAPRPAPPSEQLPQALTFFLPHAEAVRVRSALKTIAIESRWARPAAQSPVGGGSDRDGHSPEGGQSPIDASKALVLLADFYLHSRKEVSVGGQTQ